MQIVLDKPVQVRLADGRFVTLPMDTKVNFSSKKRHDLNHKMKPDVWVHTFTCYAHRQIITHIEVGDHLPSYMEPEERDF